MKVCQIVQLAAVRVVGVRSKHVRNVLNRRRGSLEDGTSNGTPSDASLGRVQRHVVGKLKISNPGSGMSIVHLNGTTRAVGV